MQSSRLNQLPPYLFVEIDRKKRTRAASGRPVLDLGIGDPDLGAPPSLVRSLCAALDSPAHHRYPPERGLPALVEAIRDWAARRHGVALEAREILVTIGSKEAIAHLPLAVADPGDVVLVPDPGYPVYNSAAVFAAAEPVRVPLLEGNAYWPEIEAVGRERLRRARLLFLNYPNNPTAAVAGEERWLEALDLCRRCGIILVNDAAYSEIFYERRPAALFPLARESGAAYLEIFSFSKTFSITGWRVGFVIGSPEVVAALARLKSNVDSGVFGAIQAAVAETLVSRYDEITSAVVGVYRERRDLLAGFLERGGYSFTLPGATFYFWVAVPDGGPSLDFCARLLDETGIVAAPGIGFGPGGEGYFRLSITAPLDTIRAAGEKLAARGVRG